jgi:hypothetical protein
VAVSLVVLVSAGLFVRSLLARQNVDPGFGAAPTGLVSVVLDAQRYDAQARVRFLDRAIDEVGSRPGITAVGAIDNLPLNVTSMQQSGVNIDGVDPPPGRLAHSVDYARIDTGYLAAVGIPIVDGRNFRRSDSGDAPEVMIVNRTMARRFWPNRSAVGRIVSESDGDPVRVVGVAGNTKVRSLGEPPRPFVYRPLRQSPSTLFTLVARTAGSAEAATATTLATVRKIDPDIIIWESKTLEEHLAVMVMPARLGAGALTGFAVLALVLAIIGLYSMVGYAVASRSREVGIRMSLGAESGRVVCLLMRDGVKLVLIGAAVGLVLAILLGGGASLAPVRRDAAGPCYPGGRRAAAPGGGWRRRVGAGPAGQSRGSGPGAPHRVGRLPSRTSFWADHWAGKPRHIPACLPEKYGRSCVLPVKSRHLAGIWPS